MHHPAAGLSFLGLGVTPPSAEWGPMLNNLRQAYGHRLSSPRCRGS
jgi:ABC-type dipeptide/oligopeptide/nickel transport system permease subunit